MKSVKAIQTNRYGDIDQRFINGVDYGHDGQFFFDADDKHATYYQGKVLDNVTQPGLCMPWQFNVETQYVLEGEITLGRVP